MPPAESKTKSKPARKASGPNLTLEKLCGDVVGGGVEEAGRGPWAGPVCAAAVILPAKRMPKGIDDSKKLNAKARESLEVEIKARALAWAVAFATEEEIAEFFFLHATGLAMRRAVEALTPAPANALVDGNYRFPL